MPSDNWAGRVMKNGPGWKGFHWWSQLKLRIRRGNIVAVFKNGKFSYWAFSMHMFLICQGNRNYSDFYQLLAKSVESVIPNAQVTYLFCLLVSKNATLDMLARSFTKNHCYDLDNAHAQIGQMGTQRHSSVFPSTTLQLNLMSRDYYQSLSQTCLPFKPRDGSQTWTIQE